MIDIQGAGRLHDEAFNICSQWQREISRCRLVKNYSLAMLGKVLEHKSG